LQSPLDPESLGFGGDVVMGIPPEKMEAALKEINSRKAGPLLQETITELYWEAVLHGSTTSGQAAKLRSEARSLSAQGR